MANSPAYYGHVLKNLARGFKDFPETPAWAAKVFARTVRGLLEPEALTASKFATIQQKPFMVRLNSSVKSMLEAAPFSVETSKDMKTVENNKTTLDIENIKKMKIGDSLKSKSFILKGKRFSKCNPTTKKWGLLATGFPPGPDPPLLRQPDPLQLSTKSHDDAHLGADAGSTRNSDR